MRAALDHVSGADVCRDGLEILGAELEQGLDEELVLGGGPVAGLAGDVALAGADLLEVGVRLERGGLVLEAGSGTDLSRAGDDGDGRVRGIGVVVRLGGHVGAVGHGELVPVAKRGQHDVGALERVERGGIERRERHVCWGRWGGVGC